MRLAISNIAWDPAEDEGVARLLNAFDIDAIDVAPGKYFSDPQNTTDEEIGLVKAWWADRNIQITGMQGLLFGTSGLNVFGPVQVQDAMLKHLSSICRIGAALGAKPLVFGSPKNRDRSGLSDDEARDMSISFFRRLGDIAQLHDVLICLESNPQRYGANFMTTIDETAAVVAQTSHPAIKMQLDTGALAINGEDVHYVLERYSGLVGHIHASECDLVPLGDGEVDHTKIFNALVRYLPSHLVSIEMLATQDETHLKSIERALKFATENYRRGACQ